MYGGNQPGEIDFGSSYRKVEFIARVWVIGSRLHVNSYPPEKLGTHFTASQEGIAQQLSLFRISSADWKVQTTLYHIINSTTGKYCSVLSSFYLNGHISSSDSQVRTTLYVQRNKQYYRKVLLSSFHLNGQI